MVPKLAGGSGKGSSFKGAALYYLHDKKALTSERVAWTHTENLATSDPETAWRVMAATALDQDRLKAQAGIKNTGRKSDKAVWVYSLAWHPDEAKDLTQDEMIRAARSSLRAVSADDRQALIVCHTDEPHPHVHVIINRVSPADGRMLSDSKAKLKLSRWAEEYERERGKIYCEERVLNNEARGRGEATYARKTAYHIHKVDELARAASNDNAPPRLRALRDYDRQANESLLAKGKAMRERHAEAWKELARRTRARRAALKDRIGKQRHKARRQVRREFRAAWRAYHDAHMDELQRFNENERTAAGRARNAFSAFMGRLRTGDRLSAIRDGFSLIASRGARRQAIHAKYGRLKERLLTLQQEAEIKAVRLVNTKERNSLLLNRETYFSERAGLIAQQSAEREALRQAWRKRARQRQHNLAALLSRDHAKPDFDRASGQSPDRENQGGIKERVKRFREQIRKRHNISNDNDREHDHERDR